MNRFKKLIERIRGKRKGPPSESIPVPASWPRKREGEKSGSSQDYRYIPREKKPFKFRVPGLRTGKRIIAGILLVFNFAISQITLTGAPASQPLALFFLLNAFLLADYIWKTRVKPQVEV